MSRRHSRRALALLLVAVTLVASPVAVGRADTVAAPVSPAAVARDTAGWIPWDHPGEPALAGSALDVSFLLDAPAGRHGFLRVKGDGFAFEDGTEARFWGGNFFGEANFPEPADAERLADIVSRAGANMVRMHHLDVVAPWTDKVVQRSLFGGQQPPTTRKLDPAMLDRFDYLVSCFKKRGVYLFLSHLSSRMVRPGDGFPGPADAKMDWGFKVVGMFDPFLIELQKEYLKQLLTHVNPYTGLPLVNDPVLALTEVVNENTTLWTQESGFFSIANELQRTMLRSQWNGWLRRKVGAREALAGRWATQEPGRVGLAEGEDPMTGTVAIPATYRDVSRQHYSDTRIRDSFAFLADLQEAYFHTMSAHLRALGLRCPLTGSNHWTDDPIDLQQNARLGYVDRHAYWTHPEGSYNYEKGQGIEPKPMVKDAKGGLVGDFARRRVQGVPYTASEWHACLPNPYRAEGPPILAAYAALQGWHPLQYAYWGTTQKQPSMINSFEVMLDPTQVSVIPASALLFHRRDVRQADAAYWDVVPEEAIADPLHPVERHPALALIGRYGLALAGRGAPEASDPTLLAKASAPVRLSTTGELAWDSDQGLVTVDTPRTQAVVGFAGGRTVRTRDVSFETTTPFAVVMVSSLDGKPIAVSKRLLVSTAADARWTGVTVSENGDKILSTGHWPFLMQPVEGRLVLKAAGAPDPARASGSALTAYRLATNGARLGPLATRNGTDGIVLTLSAANGCLHYEIVRE